MILHGKEIKVRGSNRKYHQLDNLDRLYEELKSHSIGNLSNNWNIPYNSIRWRVEKYFPEEWKKDIVIERRRASS